jgi:hypothetical protein
LEANDSIRASQIPDSIAIFRFHDENLLPHLPFGAYHGANKKTLIDPPDT